MALNWYTPGNKIKRKQNIICVYEENDQAFRIHNKIVKMFLNRLVIEEDVAFECLGTCFLPTKIYEYSPEIFDDQIHDLVKLNDHKRIISRMIDLASTFEHEDYETHFIFGTSFYRSPDSQNTSRPVRSYPNLFERFEKGQIDHFELSWNSWWNNPHPESYGGELRIWLSSIVKKKLQGSAMLTQFQGFRENLITKETSMDYEKGEISAVDIYVNNYADKYYNCRLKSSVNERIQQLGDNLEEGLHDLTGDDNVETTFFLPMLTEAEIQRVQSKDFSFLKTFAKEEDADVDEIEMKNSEHKSKYVLCIVSHRSYDLRDLNRCTTIEDLEMLEKFFKTNSGGYTDDHFQLLPGKFY